ncbi:hypothetical protein D3C71_1861710 [compost metagenome]
MGVSQNQNCRNIPKNCPTSRKNTFSTPRIIPSPAENITCSISSGTRASKAIPGKRPLISRNPRNKPRMIAKLIPALSSTITGRQILGKLIFFSRLAFSRNMLWLRRVISENRPQVSRPAHR